MATKREIAEDLNRFVEREVSGLAADVTENLAAATPKRTGWAAANWRPNIGTPLRGPIKPSGRVPQAKADQAAAVVGLAGYRIEHGSVHITNTSGYATELDRDRPFVERAINEAITGRRAASPVRSRRRR